MVQLDILVKYCGGCNCQIDRAKVVGELDKSLPSGDRLVSNTEAAPADAGVLLCGCQSACAEKPELACLARRWILVAGKSVNHRDLPENRLAEAVLQEIKKIKG